MVGSQHGDGVVGVSDPVDPVGAPIPVGNALQGVCTCPCRCGAKGGVVEVVARKKNVEERWLSCQPCLNGYHRLGGREKKSTVQQLVLAVKEYRAVHFAPAAEGLSHACTHKCHELFSNIFRLADAADAEGAR